ncbi:unnamed protein product [Lactuca virosa]|uniref:Zinc finger BED domain-containing protein RICESLEEPER 2-like n=1 Tax=Lactuca virosa TaxID=75947 RepID=A0AAU9PCE1_9ASTR|nr:unnamed protein product [Lactuca virosa]
MLLGKDKYSLMLKSSKFSKDIFREKLVRAIVMHNLPLSFVDYSGIKELFEYVSEDLNLICRNTVRSDIVNMHKKETNKLKSFLKEAPGRICLTSDLWISITIDGYISLTAHFIDENWILQKRLLNFSDMPPPHNGISLSEKVYSMLADWGIEGKLFSITLDNASVNDTFVNILKLQLNVRKALIKDGQFFHIICCAHILNLIVQDGLKEIDGCVSKVRESVKYVKASQARKRQFVDCVKLVSLDPKRGLRQDVPTSNSAMRNNNGSTLNNVNESNESLDEIGSGINVNEAWKEFDSFDYEYVVSTKKSELDLYLEEPRMPRTT